MLGPVAKVVNEARRRYGLRALIWAWSLAVLAVVDVGQGLPAVRGRPADAPGLLRLCAAACGIAAALLALPLLISVANAVRVRNCSFAAGLGFFALLPLATVVYAAPVGVLAG